MKPGILLAFLLLAIGAAYCTIPQGYVLAHNKTLIVPANAEWVDSGLNISESDYLVVSASGRWGYDPRPQFVKGPDGSVEGPGLQLGRLSAIIGNGTEFAVGSQYGGFANGAGTLKMHMYDTTLRKDNTGNVSANVLVYSKQAPKEAGDANKSQVEEESQAATQNEGPAEPPPRDAGCTAGIMLMMALIALYVRQTQFAPPKGK
ncbi:MAG: hypothetical protein N3H30_02790 [Candidatus Micrarchaeota archaeon]|nr:hypothetical protein [Candidatus Micrarchaeota archaeon]